MKTIYNVYNVHLNTDTIFFGGKEWIIDGGNGRWSYPGDWDKSKAIEYYKKGKGQNDD